MVDTPTPPLPDVMQRNIPPRAPGEPPVIFFDGVCGLCSASVDFILKRDRQGLFRFAPLQGETAAAVLGELSPDSLTWSFYLWDETGLSDRSTAALRIGRKLGGIYHLSALGWLVPRFMRDAIYGFVARNRYRWFGKKETCRIPKPAERARFLR